MNRLSTNTLVLLIAASAGTVLLIWLATAFTMIQATLGLVVVLVLPGYALVELLVGRRALGTAEHLFMILSASLAIAILGGLLLNQLPLGLRLNSWMAIFASTIMGGSLLAWLLRHRRRSEVMVPHRVPVRVTQLLLMGIAVAVASGALLFAHAPASPATYAGYTMLWMIPGEGEAANHVQLGIDSKEFVPTQYKLELLVDAQIVHEWGLIELAPNQQWQANLGLNLDQLTRGTIEANLYRLDRPNDPYRHVLLHPQIGMVTQ